MADIEKNIVIKATAETKQAEQDVNSLKGATAELEKTADKATGGIISSLKKLAKNPYMAAIGIALGAIVGVFNKLRDAIRNSDDAGTAFARLGAVLKAPLELVNRLVNTIVEGLGKLANAFTDVLLKIMPEKWREQAEAENELVVATDKLEDTERQYAENHARRASNISKLERQARDEEGLTATERKKALNEIYRLREQDYKEEKAIIEEKIRIWHLQNRNLKSVSDEQKDILTRLNVELTNVNTTYNDSLRATDRLSRTVNKKIIDDWVEIAKRHGDAKKAIAEYHEEVLKGQIQQYTEDLAGQAEEFYKAYFGEDGKKWKEYSFEGRKNILSMYEAIKIGDKTVVPRIKATYDELWKKYHIYTDEEIKDAGVKAQNDFAQMQRMEKILTIFNQIDATTKKVNEQRIESEQAVSDALTKTTESTEEHEETLEDVLKKNKEISDAIFQSVLSNYDGIEKLTRQYNKQMEGRASERGIILTKIAKSQSKDEREAYQEQLRLFDEYTSVLTGKYVRDIGKLFAVPLSSKTTNELIESVKSAGIEVSETLGDIPHDFAAMVDEDVDSLAFNLDLMNEKVKEWVNKNTENISLGANAIGAISDILGSASSMIQDDYDAIVSKGDEMTASEIEQAKELAHKQKVIADAQIILNQVMAVGNALVAASAAASQSGVLAPVVFASTLATLTASIVGMIAQLHQNASSYDAKVSELDNIKKQRGYATGGYIEGAGTATSDSIPARLSNGEAVINAKSTSMYYDLLSKINQAGGGVAFPDAKNTPILRFASGGVANSTATIVEAVKTAVKDIQPVVSVKEITRVQNKLKAKEI